MNLCIVGAGVTGQATGIGLSMKGHEVIFYDIDERKLELLKKCGYEVESELSLAIQNADILFVCVPTPTIRGFMDFSMVRDAIVNIGRNLSKVLRYRVIVVRSTVLPSTTRCRVVPFLKRYSKLKIGEDFGVCMNPEFLREKCALQDFLSPSRIVIGEFDKRSGDILEEVYSSFKVPIIRTDLDSAEIIKYVSNLFLATKISFFNEMYIICKRLGLDADLIGKAASLDPRIGEYGVYGGFPFDGKCLPKDLEAFRNFVKSLNINPKVLDAVSSVNAEIRSLNEKRKLDK